jgi:hypothetical protein
MSHHRELREKDMEFNTPVNADVLPGAQPPRIRQAENCDEEPFLKIAETIPNAQV